MDETVPPKRIKRLLREFAAKAHEEELRRTLTPLANAFDRWSRGEADSFELSDLIHAFHQDPSRDLFVRYTRRPHDAGVAYAIATASSIGKKYLKTCSSTWHWDSRSTPTHPARSETGRAPHATEAAPPDVVAAVTEAALV